MSDDRNSELAALHVGYISALLVESLKKFEKDLLINFESGPAIIKMTAYLLIVELRDKLEKAIFLK